MWLKVRDRSRARLQQWLVTLDGECQRRSSGRGGHWLEQDSNGWLRRPPTLVIAERMSVPSLKPPITHPSLPHDTTLITTALPPRLRRPKSFANLGHGRLGGRGAG